MKKIYFLALLFISTLSFGQNLLSNGGFENWTNTTTPDSWTLIENIAQESASIHGGTYSAKHTGGTKKLAQTVLGIIPGKTYTISFWHLVTGTGSGARSWSYWRSGGDATANNVTDAASDAALRPTTYHSGETVWTQFTANVIAPATTDRLYFELRTYSNTVALWDDISVVCTDCGSNPTLAITAPANAAVLAPNTTNVNVNLNISNFNVANGTGDGHIVYKINNGIPVNKFDTADIAVPVTAGQAYTVDLELVDNMGAPLSTTVTATVGFSIASYTVAANIAAIRADVAVNGLGKYYNLTGEAFVTYARTTRNQKYIQDASAAALIDDALGTITTPFIIGDGMTGLKLQTSAYLGLLQLNPLSNVTVSSTGTFITPEVVTANTLNTSIEAYESQLVRINGANFTDANGVITFAVNSNFTLNDGNDIIFRTAFAEANYIDGIVPSGNASRVVLVGRNNATVQVTARSLADVTLSTNSFDAIEGFKMYPNPLSGNVLNFSSAINAEMNVQIFDMLGKQILTSKVNNNTLNVSNLNAGIYIVKITEEGKTATRKLVVK